jgi:hypothetical protein
MYKKSVKIESYVYIASVLYEGKSVNRSQMDITRKICDIRIWKKHPFPDISSTNIDTLVPSLYQWVETCGIEVFVCCLSHVCISVSSAKRLPPSCEPLYAINTSHRKQETFMNILCTEFFFPTKTHSRTLLFGSIHPQAPSPFWLTKPATEHAHARLLPGLSWRWTVLLPSDTHREPIAYITPVLLPFVTYLLIPRCSSSDSQNKV